MTVPRTLPNLQSKSIFRNLPLILIAVLLLAACSDDDPVLQTHYVNPVWTPDGKTLVAGYDEALSTEIAPSAGRTVTRLAVKDIASRVTRIVDLGVVSTWHTLYAFDPSGTALAFVENGRILFHDLQGRQLLSFQPTAGGAPRLLAFQNTGNSFVWVGVTADGYTVNLNTYDAATWAALETTTLETVQSTEAVLSLVLTSQRSYALRLSSGLVREVDFNGTELNSYSIGTLTSDNPWHERLVYYSALGARYLYAVDGDGMMRLDLSTGAADTLVKGTITDFDMSDQRQSMVYETRTGDIWLSTSDGTPLQRMAPQNLMPRFSPAANGVAMVTRIDPYKDSLHVLLYR